MHPHRVAATPTLGKVEVWTLKSGGGWSHPVHIHFEEGVILKRLDILADPSTRNLTGPIPTITP